MDKSKFDKTTKQVKDLLNKSGIDYHIVMAFPKADGPVVSGGARITSKCSLTGITSGLIDFLSRHKDAILGIKEERDDNK